MKILWISNSPLPSISKDMGEKEVNVEGWKIKISKAIQKQNDLDLVICFPNLNIKKIIVGDVGGIKYYAFPKKNRRKCNYNDNDEIIFENILNTELPDVIHVWGSEFPHSLAIARVCEKLKCVDRLVVSVQGLVSIYASHYELKLPKRLLFTYHPLDLLYSHSISMGKKQFLERGKYEQQLFKIATNVIGRTDWDRACTKWMHPNRKYYFCNETLRDEFYSGHWKYDMCRKYTIFISQAYYPIKGFHCLLDSLNFLIKEFPNIEVRIAGANFLKRDNLKKYLLSDSYANYIRKRLNKENLKKHITFLGNLTASKMKEEYLNCNIFVSPSLIENSPNSVGEAMILGVPTISSDVGGIKNLLEHDKEGMIYPADEPYMLAYYIRKIFSDEKLARKLSENARNRALKIHNHEMNFQMLLEIYKDIANSFIEVK